MEEIDEDRDEQELSEIMDSGLEPEDATLIQEGRRHEVGGCTSILGG